MKSAQRGAAVAARINSRCMYEMSYGVGCPMEVFVSSQDWGDLGAYLDTRANYIPGGVGPLSGIKMRIDGNNIPVEVRDVGLLVLV